MVEELKNYEENRKEFSEMQQAVFDYFRKIALKAYKVVDKNIKGLQRWFTDPEIVELTELACHMTALPKFFSAPNVEIW